MQNNSSHKPTIEYWHVWTDQDGVSHQSRHQIEDFIQKGIAPGTSLQWLSQLKQSGATIIGVYPPTHNFFPIGTAMNKNLTINMGNCNHHKYIPTLVDLVRNGTVDPQKS